jgi:hypothetical protein
MMNSSVDVLSSQLKPLCSRDNHVMKYESGRSRANTGNQASYHCGSGGFRGACNIRRLSYTERCKCLTTHTQLRSLVLTP